MENLKQLIASNQLGQLKNQLLDMNPVDIAGVMEELDRTNLLIVFRILPKDICADVFSYMTSEQQKFIIQSISDSEVKFLIEDLFLDDTIDFLEEVPAGVVKKVLKNVDESTREQINIFLQYPDNCAGTIMTVEFVDFFDNITAKQAIERIRKTGVDKETVYTCYVINDERKLIGTVALRKLLVSQEDVIIREIMEDNVIMVKTHDDQEQVADTVRKYDLLSIPVVDAEGRLVGIITVDDIMDVIEEENTEDFQIMAAMAPSEEEYLKTGIFTLARNRILWLLVLMISATVTGAIIKRYEDVLAGMMILTSFIPMLTDTGGNAGSQSSTMVIRGIALGEVSIKDLYKVLWIEFRVSLICGLILAAVNFIRLVYISHIDIAVSIVVCMSILVTVLIAKIIGGTLPLAAKKLKMDPAIMASPLITTIVDALALIVYFYFAKTFLHL